MQNKTSLIFTGYNCNESCFFCSAEVEWRKHINKTTKELLNEIYSEFHKWSINVEFIWWEVTLRKDIYILLSFAKKIGYQYISIETNGTIFSNLSIAEKLLLHWLNHIVLSIHWSNSIINDKHTLLKWSFNLKEKWLNNLEKLHNKYKFILNTNYVITSKNINNVPEFITFISKYKYISKIIFAFVRPLKKYEKDYENYLPNIYDIKNIFENIADNELDINIQYLPYCILDNKFNEKYLNFFKKWKKKSINKLNINSVINLEDSIQKEEYYFNECNSCEYKENCRWIWTEYVSHFKLKSPLILNKDLILMNKEN